MAVKDGSGPRPAAHSAKHHFLNWLETSFKFCLYLPFCTASVEITCIFLQIAFVLHSSGPRTLSQVSNTMTVKHGSGPRPAAHIAKRYFLKWLETGFKFCFYLPFCTASVEIACVFLQFVFVLHSSGPRTLSQVSNTMVVKDGSGPRPAAHNTKYYLLSWLKTSFIFFSF